MTSEEILKAESIIKEWFWQPDSWHRKSVVRYYESAPIQPDVLQLVIAYLKQEETSSLFILNKKIPLGETWKATDAWFQTSPSDKWAGTESTKVRIYQSFKPKADESDGPYSVENGCKYLVTHEFHWDVSAIPTLPASSSGIQYTLHGVTRDKDTGLYSCVIEKRETVQQDVAEYGTSETAFESRKEELHLGVKQTSVAGTGKKASVSSGTIVRRRVTKNPDCTSDVQNETIKEKPVTGATVEYRRTLRGTTEIKTDRSQNAQLGKSGLAVGETRRSEKTEGGLWNNTVSKTTKDPVGETGEGCERSDLEHRHTTLENLATKPTVEQSKPAVNESLQKIVRRTDEDTWDVTTTRIVYTPKDTGTIVAGSQGTRTETKVGVNQPTIPAGGVGGINELRRVSAQPNDHGSFSTTEEKIVYTPDRVNLQSGNAATSVDLEIGKNQPSVSGGRGGMNQDVTISAQKNDHGSYDDQKRTINYTPDRVNLQSGNAATSVDLEIGKNQPSVSGGRGRVNQDVTISAQKNDHGSYDYQKRTINYTPDRVNLQSGNAATTVDLEIGKNQPSVSGGRGGVNQDVTISAQKNDHGSYDYQKRTIVYKKASTVSQSSWATEKIRTTRSVNDTNLNPSASVGTASASPNDHGSATTEVSEYKPIPKDSDWIKWDSTTKLENGYAKFKHAVRIFVNLATPPTPPSGSNCHLNVHINKFGLYDGNITYSDLVEWNKSGGGGVEGGIQRGTARFYQYKHDALGKSWRRLVTVNTITYYGSGNEGSEANTASAQTSVGGFVPKGKHTYIVGAPTEGPWQSND